MDNLPKPFVVIRPNLSSVINRRPHDGEAFMPHKLGVELRYPGLAIAGVSVRVAQGLRLLASRESEEALSLRLDTIDEHGWEAMASELKCSPVLTCMANKLCSIGVHEVDDGYGGLLMIIRVGPISGRIIKASPHVRFR